MNKSFVILFLLFFVTGRQFTGCANSKPLNDFFGITMDTREAENFKIVSYNPKKGATYYSTPTMDPRIHAYAGIDINLIKIKVANLSDEDISYHYNTDEFKIITKEGITHVLSKGERKNYPSSARIKPNQTVQFNFELPTDFWRTVGLSNPTLADPNYLENFWAGENSLKIIKENIKMITVKLDLQKPVILKALPEKVE